MSKIADLFPELTSVHVRALAELVAGERDLVTRINKPWAKAAWGTGCLRCEAAMLKVKAVAGSATYPWLGFHRERGQAYTVTVDGVPMRIQPDVEEIREAYPTERGRLNELRARQTTMFDRLGIPAPTSHVLRLETTQLSGQLVSQIVLYLFDEHSGATLDAWRVYSSEQHASIPSDLRRPPQDATLDNLYEFPSEPANDQSNNGDT